MSSQLLFPVTDHAWRDRALTIVETLPVGAEFQVFDLTRYGLDEPTDPSHQWGALGSLLGQKARKRLLVEFAGYSRGRRPTVNGSAVAVWRRI